MARPSKPKAAPIAEPEPDNTAANLDLATRYPFRWFPSGEVGKMCGFAKDVMAAFAGMGAPIVAKKSNPHLLHLWLQQNLDKIGKIRGDSE